MQTSVLEVEPQRQAVRPQAGDGQMPARVLRRMVVDERRALAAYHCASITPQASPGTPVLARPTFVRCTGADLREGRHDHLDPQRVEIELHDASDDQVWDLAMLQTVRRKGFKLAFDARLLRKENAAFVPLASYVVLEMGVLELDRAAALARGIHSGTKAVALATHVSSAFEYRHLASSGVKLFEGLWFTQPSAKPDKSVQLSYASLIQLLNMVVREAELHEIEDLLRHEPTLSYKLLTYINSPGFGLHVEITSFRHAVMTVGMKRLFRWTALLIGSTPSGSVAPAVGTLAIVRGRLMELLALPEMSQPEADMAFVVGMFSMLDTLLNMPLSDALALLNLPVAMTEALLQGQGRFAPYLDMVKACESADEGQLMLLASRHGVSCERMVATHLEALAWGEQFAR